MRPGIALDPGVGFEEGVASHAVASVERVGAREEAQRRLGEVDVHEEENHDGGHDHAALSLLKRELVRGVLELAVALHGD